MKRANCSAAWCATILPKHRSAAAFGQRLLSDLGVDHALSEISDHPAVAWKRSGLLELCGRKDGPARMVPLPISAAADGAMIALKSLCEHPERLPDNGAMLLGERARLSDLQRNGRASTGGYCRLIDTQNGRIALNLARDDDWGLLAAWLEEPAETWADIAEAARSQDGSTLVARGVQLGMAIALDHLPEQRPWFEEVVFVSDDNRSKQPLVVDLSGLWAGPLAGNLLHLAGANVVKVESLARPDGARRGNVDFYRLLNGGKQSVAIDFGAKAGCADLKKLIAAADIVIEASRPRALLQLGIDAEQLLAEKPGKVWLRLTAHGIGENRVGFGDDIGVAAGLVTIMERAWGEPMFVGDAIADPLSGLFGALAAWTKWQAGGGCLINLSMRDVVRQAMQVDDAEGDWADLAGEWQSEADSCTDNLYPMRSNEASVEALGESSKDIMAGLC